MFKTAQFLPTLHLAHSVLWFCCFILSFPRALGLLWPLTGLYSTECRGPLCLLWVLALGSLVFRPLFLDFLLDTVRTSLYQPALDVGRCICHASHQGNQSNQRLVLPKPASQPPIYPQNEYKHGSRTSWKQPRWVHLAICRHGINERGVQVTPSWEIHLCPFYSIWLEPFMSQGKEMAISSLGQEL